MLLLLLTTTITIIIILKAAQNTDIGPCSIQMWAKAVTLSSFQCLPMPYKTISMWCCSERDVS